MEDFLEINYAPLVERKQSKPAGKQKYFD